MAVSTSTVFSFASVGIPASVSHFDPYESTTDPKRPVGFKVEDVNGNVYRWAHFGATTTQGKVVSQDISESSYVDTDNVIVAPASAQTVTDGTLGSYYVEITLAAVTADMFAGGWICITDDTGEGYTYPVVGNTATGDPASGNFRVQLGRPLQVAVTSDSDFTICGNPYANLEPATSNTDFLVVGVSMGSQAAADYGWVCTKGIVGVLTQGTTTAGNAIVLTTTAGAVADSGTQAVLPRFGICVADGDSTGYTLVKINCE